MQQLIFSGGLNKCWQAPTSSLKTMPQTWETWILGSWDFHRFRRIGSHLLTREFCHRWTSVWSPCIHGSYHHPKDSSSLRPLKILSWLGCSITHGESRAVGVMERVSTGGSLQELNNLKDHTHMCHHMQLNSRNCVLPDALEQAVAVVAYLKTVDADGDQCLGLISGIARLALCPPTKLLWCGHGCKHCWNHYLWNTHRLWCSYRLHR